MKKQLIGACASLLLSGCAGVIHGTSDHITINSLEKDTIIYVDGVKRGLDDALV